MRDKVDPLPPGKLQQQVERALEPIEIDGESRFARGLDTVKVDSETRPLRPRITSARMLTRPARGRQGAPTGRQQPCDRGTIPIYPPRLQYMVHTQKIFVRISTRNTPIIGYVT